MRTMKELLNTTVNKLSSTTKSAKDIYDTHIRAKAQAGFTLLGLDLLSGL